jgi:co-chaperonin GroES (HSP10)
MTELGHARRPAPTIDASKLRSLTDKALVLVDPDEQETASGILLRVNTIGRDPILTGRVLATGDGAVTKSGKVIPIGVAKGERVAFKRGCGWEFDTTSGSLRELVDGDETKTVELIALREDMILGVLEDE